MKYSQAQMGRTFVIRLENGDVIHDEIQEVADDLGIRAGVVIAVGAADCGSKLVVGPTHKDAAPIEPMEAVLSDVHEAAGVGTIFPDAEGKPVLHMHVACGRESNTVTGCVRRGVRTWQTMELVLIELVGSTATRQLSETLGFHVLEP